MFLFYSAQRPVVLCGLELHRGRASGKKEGQETFDTMKPRGEKLCVAANISVFLVHKNIPVLKHFVCGRHATQIDSVYTLDLSLSSPQQFFTSHTVSPLSPLKICWQYSLTSRLCGLLSHRCLHDLFMYDENLDFCSGQNQFELFAVWSFPHSGEERRIMTYFLERLCDCFLKVFINILTFFYFRCQCLLFHTKTDLLWCLFIKLMKVI